MDGRLIQRELVRREFPDLARLPVDRSSLDTTPLDPSTLDHVLNALRWRLDGLHPWRWWRSRREQLYYARLYDLQTPGWIRIREMAEPHRHRLSPLFHVAGLTEGYLPPPQRSIEVDSPTREGSGRKLLLGLMLLLGEHPALLEGAH